jgi:hypothetical protein
MIIDESGFVFIILIIYHSSLLLFFLRLYQNLALVAHVALAVGVGVVENMGLASGLALGNGRDGSPVVRTAGAGTLLRMFISRIWHRCMYLKTLDGRL